jgi:tRNA-dihydrouridine synthase
MIGRGIFANPWFFNKQVAEKSPEERLNLLWKHASLFTHTWQDEKHFAILKRFFKIYTSGFYGAAHIRALLMETHSLEDVRKVLEGEGYEMEG